MEWAQPVGESTKVRPLHTLLFTDKMMLLRELCDMVQADSLWLWQILKEQQEDSIASLNIVEIQKWKKYII